MSYFNELALPPSWTTLPKKPAPDPLIMVQTPYGVGVVQSYAQVSAHFHGDIQLSDADLYATQMWNVSPTILPKTKPEPTQLELVLE